MRGPQSCDSRRPLLLRKRSSVCVSEMSTSGPVADVLGGSFPSRRSNGKRSGANYETLRGSKCSEQCADIGRPLYLTHNPRFLTTIHATAPRTGAHKGIGTFAYCDNYPIDLKFGVIFDIEFLLFIRWEGYRATYSCIP